VADAADQATIPAYRMTGALAALGQELGERLSVEPRAGLDRTSDPELQGYRDACDLLNAAAADVVRIEFLPGVVQLHRVDGTVLTLEVVDA